MFQTLRARVLQPGANPGLSVLFDGLVVMTTAARGRVLDRSAADMRGIDGAFLIDITGPGGARWYAEIRPGFTRFFRGTPPKPLATISLSVDEVFRLLTGKSSPVTSQMTGKLRVSGDGHGGLIFGGLVHQLRAARARPGPQGQAARRWLDLATRLSRTGHRFPKERTAAR